MSQSIRLTCLDVTCTAVIDQFDERINIACNTHSEVCVHKLNVLLLQVASATVCRIYHLGGKYSLKLNCMYFGASNKFNEFIKFCFVIRYMEIF